MFRLLLHHQDVMQEYKQYTNNCIFCAIVRCWRVKGPLQFMCKGRMWIGITEFLFEHAGLLSAVRINLLSSWLCFFGYRKGRFKVHPCTSLRLCTGRTAHRGNRGSRGGPQWLRCCATNRKVAGSIPDDVIGIFLLTWSFRSHYGPGVDSASNRNEYQEDFLGVNAAGA